MLPRDRGWDIRGALGRTWTKSSQALPSLFSSLSCSRLPPTWVGAGAEFQRIPEAGASLLFPLAFLDDDNQPVLALGKYIFPWIYGCVGMLGRGALGIPRTGKAPAVLGPSSAAFPWLLFPSPPVTFRAWQEPLGAGPEPSLSPLEWTG